MLHYLEQQCKNLAKSAADVQKLDYLSRHVRILRYEDIALNPAEMAAEIYKFTSLDFTENMKKWLDVNTNSRVRK